MLRVIVRDEDTHRLRRCWVHQPLVLGIDEHALRIRSVKDRLESPRRLDLEILLRVSDETGLQELVRNVETPGAGTERCGLHLDLHRIDRL